MEPRARQPHLSLLQAENYIDMTRFIQLPLLHPARHGHCLQSTSDRFYSTV